MKNHRIVKVWVGVAVFMVLPLKSLCGQKLTTPDYSYGFVHSEYGMVSQSGIASPGPAGGYSGGEEERQSGVFLAKGYRWWGYPSYVLMICGKLPDFDFPGKHGITDMSGIGCANPPIGFKGSWGGVITEPGSRTIWSITGAKNHNGPTAPFCIPNPFGSGQICYSPPSIWGYGSSYGYLRKAFVVQSTGALQNGDRVDVKAGLTARITHEGDGTASGMGVLFLQRISEAPWYQSGFGREYLTWGTIQDFFGMALPRVVIGQSGVKDSTMIVAIGDTIIVEVGFNNTISLSNPGSSGEDSEGWSGERPGLLFGSPVYARTDTIKKLIKKHGNSLKYDLTCLTQGALLTPLESGGPNVDEDKDGLTDAREKGPDGNDSNFDGNADGIPDYKQANVASFHTYDGDNYLTLVVPEGVELSQVIATGNPNPATTPADAEFPWGFFDFTIDGIEPGDGVTVTIILHGGIPVGKYYKYGITPDNLEPHWYEFMYNGQTGAVINGNEIVLHFVDGLRGDEDISVNGTIKDPGGPSKSTITGNPALYEENGKVLVYPNPANENITILMSNIFTGNDYALRISALSGKLMHNDIIDIHFPQTELSISTADFRDGIYLVTLSGKGFIYKAYFIIIK